MAKTECSHSTEQLLSLLATRTRTLWRMTGSGSADEIMTPYRQAVFLVQSNGAWQSYQDNDSSREKKVSADPSDALAFHPDSIAQQAYRFFEARAFGG